MRLETAMQSPDAYMQCHMGYSLSQLLAPIGDEKVGESVRHNGVYSSIKEARKADDPTLPMGVWTYDLKTADWSQVKNIALNALAEKSKDLQLGIWLFEANLHLEGIGGIAPAALLIQEMCAAYWPDMHPKMIDGDVEFRTNPLNWINEKLTPIIKSLPITQAKLDGEELSWNDWESAQHFEKLKQQKQLKTPYEGPTTQDFKQRMAATESAHLMGLVAQIEDALQALDHLQTWLDDCCGDASPSFGDINSILHQIDDTLRQELNRRGISFSQQQDEDDAADHDNGSESADGSGGGDHGGSGGNGSLVTRDDAFAALRRAADFLIKDDPHSMVPYLIYTACDWGKLSAPELYQEIFLQKGGQINVFEIMGIEGDQA
ncbi:type VI secretion system protein TssA [Marinomonas transparens]|uniref:Type VI secretion system protein TssA n=1 Tax=Marinomonas transparens TaxID=2795388 RepID=A0A934JQC4_9GAMM|nr:type VI secretion system protein TssA [Marinomonas transparens]MBJ7540001.1 type VI secretion system protein TssA [Marinomonas transparens]